MGASYGPVSVRLSVTSWCSIKRDGRINLRFGMEASFDHPTLHFKEIRVNGVTSPWNFFLNSGLRKFCHSVSFVEHAVNLARERRTVN